MFNNKHIMRNCFYRYPHKQPIKWVSTLQLCHEKHEAYTIQKYRKFGACLGAFGLMWWFVVYKIFTLRKLIDYFKGC